MKKSILIVIVAAMESVMTIALVCKSKIYLRNIHNRTTLKMRKERTKFLIDFCDFLLKS